MKKEDPFQDKFFTDTKRYMRKRQMTYVVIILLIVGFYCITITLFTDDVKNKKQRREPLVGKEIVIRKDTLTIMDYSVLKDCYILSNGTECSEALVKAKIKL